MERAINTLTDLPEESERIVVAEFQPRLPVIMVVLFGEADEAALLRARRIDALVTKNSGGVLTYAKLAAARKLGLPVVMIGRPGLPEGDIVHDVETAVDRIAAQVR